MIATTEAGASPEAARSWWLSYLPQQANTRGVELGALPITPAQVAQVVALIDSGKLNRAMGGLTPNPVRSALRAFGEDFERSGNDHR